MNRKIKAFAGLFSLLLLTGGATAFAIQFQTDKFFSDAHDVPQNATLGEMFRCNALSSYFVQDCAPPVKIEPNGQTVSETQWSIANTAAAASDGREQLLGSIRKRLNASYGIAMAEAKQEGIKDLNSGASEPIAESNATDVVRNWYAQIQENAINYRNRHILKINASLNEISRTSGLSKADVFRVDKVDGAGNSFITGAPQKIEIKKFNKTLFNGNNATAYKLRLKLKNQVNNCGQTTHWFNYTQIKSYKLTKSNYKDSCQSTDITTRMTDADLRVVDPNGNKTMFFDAPKYVTAMSSIKGTKDRAISNTRTVIGNIFATYQTGQINTSDAFGPLEALKTASTSYASTGYFDYATLTAKQMGLQTNDSYAFNLEWSPQGINQSYQDTGQLFLDDTAFNGTIKTNQTYNVTDQTVWFTRTNSAGNIVQEDLNGTFTVLEMTNKRTGEKINQTRTQDIQVYESNVTDLKNQLDFLRKQLKEYQTDSSGGAGGLFSGLSGLFSLSPAGTGALALIAILLLLVAGGFFL